MISKKFFRGGKKSIKSSNTLISRNKLRKKKITMESKLFNDSMSKNKKVGLSNAQNLKYSTLCEGMIIIGRIFKITEYYAIVSLPGQISGKLRATDLSESYTNLLKNIANNEIISDDFRTISNIYKQGDYIICYVKEINFQTRKITLSTEPKLINGMINFNFLTKYSKLALTVSSVEDHGYALETGMSNLRAFLSLEDVQDDKMKLYIGKQILCSVKNIKKDDKIFTTLVSLQSEQSGCGKPIGLPLDNCIPGTQFSLVVEKVLKNGLQVYFNKNIIGYISQFYIKEDLAQFQKGQELVGTLLYILPTVKFAYFSLLSQEQESQSVAIGDIISEARTLMHDSKGVFIQIKKGIRGYIPLKRTEVDYKNIQSVFKFNSIHKCKVIAYDSLAQLYICSVEKKLLKSQYTNVMDLKTGNIVDVFITHIDKETGYLTVCFGKTFGTVPPDQISDSGLQYDLKIGDNVKARILDSSNKILFTLKKSLVQSKLPILCKFEDATVNRVHHGSVVKISNEGVLVRFFDKVKGWIPKRFLNTRNELKNWGLVLGETIITVIKSVNTAENKITLALSKCDTQTYFEIGDVVEGVVTDSSVDGVHLRIEKYNCNFMAYLPAGHMSPCLEVGQLLAAKTIAGDKLSVIVFSIKPNLIMSTTFAPERIYNDISDLTFGDTILCSVKNIYKESIKVLMPIKNSQKYGAVSVSHVENIEAMYKNQILFAKVIQAVGETHQVRLTTHFSKVWKDIVNPEIQMLGAVNVLCSYLNKILELSKNVFYTCKPISRVHIGQRIKGTILNVMNDGLILNLEGNIKGIIRKDHFLATYKNGEQVEGSVLWVNYPNEYIELSLLPTVMKNISIKQNKLAKIPIGIQLRGEIVLVTSWFILVLLKGQSKGTLVTLPARRHLNDIVPDLSPYQIGSKIRCYGILNRHDVDIILPICILKSVFEKPNYMKNMSLKSLPVPKKRKAQESLNDKKCPISKKKKKNNEENSIENKKKTIKCQMPTEKDDTYMKYNMEQYDDKIVLVDESNTKEKEKKYKDESANDKALHFFNLSIYECGFDWNNLKSEQGIESSSDSEIEMEELNKKKKKKKTTADRHDKEQKKEREVRENEEILATCQKPQTVHQFDRLVLANPDNSLLWVQYMVYHLQVTEIEKARSVARRALKSISFREENEKVNIWKAWLNLELRFGTLETLNKVFQEALKTSNAERICTHMLTLYLNAGRYGEMEKIVDIMIAKFKQNLDIWIKCGEAMLEIGLKDKSRHIMQRALQSLPEHKHVDLIVKFATLENKFGNKERSQTLFESILEKYKNRTDVWSSYTDSLVKSGEIEIARKVLERAVMEINSVKKMKILFKKYFEFEKKYGSEERILHVHQLTAKYIQEQCK